MVSTEAGGPALPNLPLVKAHRSGVCRTLVMADSRSARSLSAP
jgi:hypothetical protein